MRGFLVAAMLVCMALSAGILCAQTSNGSVSGLVHDKANAVIPGVAITLTGTDTGVATTVLSNESGAYRFASVLPGNYKLGAELSGFRPTTLNGVIVGTSAQVRFDITMEIGVSNTNVEVAVSSQQLLTESSASIGQVLATDKVTSLPLVSGEVLDLVRIMPGMRVDPFGDAFSTFTGLQTSTINTVRDGLSVTDTRNANGISGTTTLNPDLIGEIRIILTPVDAELGRGNGQIQISTRSGTNKYTGSAVWNIRNSAFSANSWNNNRAIDPVSGLWKPIPLDWQNTNQVTLSYGGPIVKNKTFFYALYDQNISRNRALVSNNVLTDTARQGIMRYWSGWNPGNANVAPPTFPVTNGNGVYASADAMGNPVAPLFNPDGSPYTGSLQCFSVFGNKKSDGSPFTPADCLGGNALLPVGTATAWDSLRPSFDSSGYIQKILASMPHANFFAPSPAGAVVDGLNLAQNQYIRGKSGVTGATNGLNPMNTNRKQINIKIDQNFNPKNRLSVGWSLEHDDNDENLSAYADGVNGIGQRHPQVLTANFTSTLSPTMVNEARFGITYGTQNLTPPWLSKDQAVKDIASTWLLQGGANPANGIVYPVLATAGAGNYAFSNGIVNLNSTYSGSQAPLFNYADTLSWTRGHHAFKFGAELRLTRSDGFSGAVYPTVTGGAGGNNSPIANSLTGIANAFQPLSTTRTNAANLLYLLNGSVNSAQTAYWIDTATDVANGTWQDITTEPQRYRKQVANESDFFVKDDWKVNDHLTLNLGVRWEYYGSPYLRGGYTASIAGQGGGLFGAARSDVRFDNWMAPGNLFLSGYGSPAFAGPNPLSCQKGVTQSALLPVSTCDPEKLTTLIYVGPDSANPDQTTIPSDFNNFGPAIGFAWQQGQTVVRGGMQITFGGAGRNGGATENLLGNATGSNSTGILNTADFPTLVSPTRALVMGDIPLIVPVKPTAPAVPAGQIPIYNRNTAFTAYDPEFATPYVQNFTLSVTRNVGRNYTVDLRYVGTMGRKRSGIINLNQPNVYYNPELLQALKDTRAGLDSPLFDQMFAGLNLNTTTGATSTLGPDGVTRTYGPVGTVVGGVLQTGSAALRRNATFATNLAIGNFDAVASALNTLATTAVTGAEAASLTGVGGAVLRNGCNRIADGKYNPALPANTTTNIPTRCFAENYIVANPQLSTASYTANLGTSNYHSMQAQVTARPIQGITVQTTYTLSKLLGLVAPGANASYTDPLNRDADYTLPYQNVTHDLRTNGTFDLPIGPNKLLLGNSSGWLARAVEKWQTSVIFNTSSGNPRTVVAGHMLYASGNQNLDAGQNRADVVSALFDTHMRGHAEWSGSTGSYYGIDKYVQVKDPQCLPGGPLDHYDTMGVNLATNATGAGTNNCNLSAMAIRNPDGSVGPIVLQNPLPGNRGTMPMSLEALGKWRFDANIGKTFRISESKSFSIRLDSTNVLNHPDLIDPDPQTGSSINTSGLVFGRIQSKGGAGANTQPRTFQLQARFSF